MSDNELISLAQSIVQGQITLGNVLSEYGYDIAEMVHNYTITRPFQVVKWVRRIR